MITETIETFFHENFGYYKMTRHLINILQLTVVLLLTACTDELKINSPSEFYNDELIVDFDFRLPEARETRATNNSNGIEVFANGDMIHIIGTFKIKYLKDGATGDEYEEDEVSRYGALRYNGKNWVEVDGSTLTWPAVATTGTFEAFYISESNGVLTGTSPTEQFRLSNLTATTDPLKAVSDEDIPYGHAVRLEFSHICAYLTLVDLEPMVSDSYWFTTNGPKDESTNSYLQFNNAFQISLGERTDGKGPTLKFDFCQMPDSKYTPELFIAAKAVVDSGITTDTYPNGVTTAGYFLEPGFYEKFEIIYPATDSTVYKYLEYDYTVIPSAPDGTSITNNKPDLKSNTPYTLTITKSPGITINIPPSGEGWDESDEYFDVDVEEFLKSVSNQTDYTNSDDVKILEKTSTGIRLLHNIDFNNFDYNEIKDPSFRPNNMAGSIFDGDYHYIKNVGSCLIRYNYGTIRNLGLKDVNITTTSYENDSENDDMSRNGALCMWNWESGTIENIRLSNVNLTVNVRSLDPEGQETHNIGGVVGSNTGSIEEVAMSGDFNIIVQGESDNEVNASVLIGGIVGQNAGMGNISEVSPQSGTPKISITNKCKGDLGSYSVGGFVGESQGFINGVILTDIRIDGTESTGVTSYMGGIAGQLQVSTTSSAEADAMLESCIVGGTIKAGVSKPYKSITSVSYTGGITGTVLSVPVVDCRSAVGVYGSSSVVENVVYGTGGAIGRIREGDNYEIKDIIAYGSVLEYPQGEKSYVGNFAGIIPDSQTEGDYSNKNIIVYTFPGIKFIGGFLPSVLN